MKANPNFYMYYVFNPLEDDIVTLHEDMDDAITSAQQMILDSKCHIEDLEETTILVLKAVKAITCVFEVEDIKEE